MCYSSESSILAWVISVVIGCYLWYRNRRFDRWNASFIWTFSAIQLWEAGIWSTNVKSQQELYVKLIALTLTAQPLVQTFSAWKATGERYQLLKIMTGVYALIWLYTLYRTMNDQFWANKGPNGHLMWHSSGGGLVSGPIDVLSTLYLLGVFLGLFYGIPGTIPLIAIGIITFIWSMSRVSSGEFGSYWCYAAVAYSITALFV